MKQFFYTRKSKLLLFMLLAFFAGGVSPTWADELTIANGGNTNQYVPLYGSYADTNGAVSEFIVPAASLTSLNGKDIKKLTFYTSTPSDKVFTATFKVYLKEIEETEYSDATAFGSTDATTVYTGTLDATGATMVIEFSNNYKYNGGNLLVGIQVTSSGNWSSALMFSGETQSTYTGFSSKATTKKQKFIPKTTFTTQIEGSGFEVKDGSTKLTSAYSYNFGLATAGTTKTFTLSNPGTEATPISVDVTGANGFTATVQDNATSIPAGGEKTLTITMPDATASGSIVVTPTGTDLSAFTFNVSGTIIDPNKIYLTFSDGKIPDGWSSVYTGTGGDYYNWAAQTGYVQFIGGSSYKEAFTSPKLTFAASEKVFFEVARYGSSSYTPGLTVEFSADGTDWSTYSGIAIDNANIIYGTWTSQSVTIPSADVKYIRFNGYYLYLRNIYGGELPLNPTPKDLAYSTLTNTSAQLSWTSTATNFNIQYKVDGAGDWTTIENVTSNPYALTGLSAATTYQVKVQADHGVNGLSDYTDPISFTTKPDPISAYPYTENFNSLSSGEIPQYWDNSEGTTTEDSYKWSYNTSYGTGHEGKCVRFDSYNNNSGKTNFLKTRPFSWASGKAMKLSFWYKNPAGGDFSVYASTDGGTSYPTELATGLTGKNDWTLKEIDIPAAVFGNNVVIVFKGTSNYANGDARLYLDDMTISEVSDYSLAISGSDVNENTIAFGSVKNTTTTKTFTITNDGGEDLTGISVVSSDATVFTVSDTDFDLASGATKDITVTFVKGVAGDYSKTITISQDNVASDKVLTVTGTYVAPDPATIAVKLGGSAVGASVAFGTVGKAKSKTFTVENTGEVALDITSIASNNTTDFTVSPSTLTIEGGQSGTFTVTFVWDGEAMNAEKTANIAVTPSNAGLDPVVFAVTGTRDNLWSADFEGENPLNGWENTGFTVKNQAYLTSTVNGTTLPSKFAVSNYSSTASTLTTPLLEATAGDQLTFDAYFAWGDETLKVEWSTDKENWHTDAPLYNYDKSSYSNGSYHTIEITAPTTGTFYLRFSATYSNAFDNIEGFKLAQAPEYSVYSDNSYANEKKVTMAESKDFGFVDEAKNVSYYIKNTGNAAMKLAAPVAQAPLTASFSDASAGVTESGEGDAKRWTIPANGTIKLNITMSNATAGEYTGKTVTVTADDEVGAFVANFSGIVTDNDHFNVDFSTEGIPGSWTNANEYFPWTKNSNYISTSGSANLITAPLVATTGDKLYIQRDGNALTVKYKKSSDADFTSLQELAFTANKKIETLTMPAGLAADRIELQFSGSDAKIYRIYGLVEPIEARMVVRNGETILTGTENIYNFGCVTSATNKQFTITNNGSADLTGLEATLTGTDAADYEVAVSKTDVPFTGENTATVTVTLKANAEYKKRVAVLTISAENANIADVAINLSGKTRNAAKQYVDFDTPNEIPASWTAGTSWGVYTFGTDRYAQQEATIEANASALTMVPVTVAEGEKLLFQAGKKASGTAMLKVRYTTNGGATWTEVDKSASITSTDFVDLELDGISAGTAMIEFFGYNVKINNVYGFVATSAPVLALTEGDEVVANGDTKAFGSLTAAGVATYTLKNTGNDDMVSVVSTTGVATAVISGEGEGITLAKVNDSETYNKVTLAAGKSATITLTVPYASPYEDKNGSMTIDSEGWVGDMVVNYTSTIVNPNALNVDFADNKKPEGWYFGDNWIVYNQETYINYNSTPVDVVTQKLHVGGTTDALTFDALKMDNSYTFKVYTSTDRVNWTEYDHGVSLTNTYQAVTISGLAEGDYYVKISGAYVKLDNFLGWTKVTGIEHDLYVTATSFPATTDKGDDATITATVTSLRADETGVYAKLFIDGAEEATSDAQDINLNASKTFSFTYAIPENKTAQIKVYFSDDTKAFATASNNMKVRYAFDEEVDPNAIAAGTFEVNMDRTFVAGWNTICLPFDINVTDIHAEAKAFSFDAYDEGTKALTFNKVTTTLEAGKPYVIYVPEAITTALQFNGIAITATEADKSEHTMTFQGTYAPMTAGSLTDCCGLTASGKIAKAKSTTTMKGFRGYFKNVPAGARVMFNGFDDDETTGIRMITIDNTAAEGTYNMQGQKVEQLKKGRLYIINGKKQVVK